MKRPIPHSILPKLLFLWLLFVSCLFASSDAFATVVYTGGTFTLGSTINITNTGTTTSGTFSLSSGSLTGTGLSLNTTTGAITGTPSSTFAVTLKVHTTGGGGQTSGSFTITLINPPVLTYASPNIYTYNTAISSLSPSNSGGAVASLTGYSAATALTTTGMDGPFGMASDAVGNVYVCNFTGTSVYKYTNGAGTATSFITGLTTPEGMAFDSQGNCYVLGGSGIVKKYNSSGTAIPAGNYTFTGTIGTTYGLAIDASDNLYITNYSGSTYQVLKYNTTTLLQTTFASAGSLSTPEGIAVDASGNVFVLNSTGTVVEYNAGGTVVNASFISGLTSPYGIAIDQGGFIYIANYGGVNTVNVYNPSGTAIATISSVVTCDGLTVDSKGNLYTATYVSNAGSVNKYTPKGGYFISNLPQGLKFDGTTGIITGTPTAPQASTSYSVTGYNADGSSSPTFAISVIPPAPTASGATTMCPGTATLGATGTPTGGTFNWYAGASGGSSLFTGIPYTPTVNTTTTYYVDYTVNGATSSTRGAVTVTINPPPDGTFTATPATVNVNTASINTNVTVTYTGADVAPSTWAWDFNGGTPATGTGQGPFTVTWATAGTKTVTLTITNANGCQTITTQTVTVLQPPSISYSPATQVFPTNVAITTPYSPGNTGGAVGSFGYGAGAQLPAGTSAINKPYAIAFDAAGNIYIANSGANNILKYNADGTYNSGNPFISNVTNPTGIVFDSQGNCYVLSEGTNSIVYKYTSAGGSTLPSPLITNSNASSYGLAIDASDNLYITSYHNTTYKVLKYSSGGTPETFGITTSNLNQPTGITVDPSGNVYVFNNGSGRIYEFPSAGTGSGTRVPTTTSTFGTTPYAITSDAAGNIYIGNYSAGSISVYNGATQLGSSITGLTTPAGVGVDKYGNLYISSLNGNTVTKYIPNGGYFLNTALPTGLSFDNTTGNITGTPTVATAAANYTIIAYGSNSPGDTSSTTVSIGVQFSAPNISYTTPDSYPVGTTITSPTLTNTSNAVGAVGYGAGTAFSGTTLNGPMGMATDNAGNVYIANATAGNILKFSPSGVYSGTPFISGVTNPVGLVFDSQGNCYVLSEVTNASKVYKYDSTGAPLTPSPLIGSGLATCFGIAIDATDHIYITNISGTTYTVKKYSSSGVLVSGYNITATSQPYGIAIDPSNNIYIANHNSTTVFKCTACATSATGGAAAAFLTGMSNPAAVSTDAAGNIYVGDSAHGLLKVYAPAGGTALTTITITDPEGVAIGPDGTLYSTNKSGSAADVYTPTGGYFLNTALPTGLTLSVSTGAISGKPTTSTAAADYIVTAWNTAGSGNTDINITCYSTFTWSSTSSTSWTTAANWGGTVPGPADQAVIGNSTSTTTYPIITSDTQVGSIVFNNKYAASHPPTLTVNGATLTVTGDITYQSNVATATTATLTGSGSITANNLYIKTLSGTTYTNTLTSSLTNGLVLGGNLSLTSLYGSATKVDNVTFNLSSGSLTVNDIVTSNANTANTATITIGNNTTLNFTDSDPLSGLTSTGKNTITIGTGTTIGYTGNNNQLFYTNTAIANTNPSLSLSYANLSFGGTGVKTPEPTGTINVSGNFTNTLANDATDYVDFSGNTVNFNGSTAQTIAGGPGTTAGTTFYNVNFSSGGTKTFTTDISAVASSGILTMSGNTALAGGGFLTLNSDVTGSATVAAIPSGSSITGTVNVQRFITGGNINYRGYRLLSSAVSDPSSSPAGAYYNLSYLKGSGTFLTGASGGGFDATGNPTIYLYNEGAVPDNSSFTTGNYRAVTAINGSPTYNLGTIDGNHNMPIGNGFMFFYRGNNSTDATVVPSSLVFSSPGSLNQGQVTVSTWNNTNGATFLNFSNAAGNANAAVKGFNLVGNPYPSTIDWETFNTSSSNTGIYAPVGTLSNTIYTINPLSHLYATYMTGGGSTNSGSNFIVSGQGFFVQAVASGAQLIFNESAKASTQPGTLLLNSAPPAVADQHLRLKLVQDSVNAEDIYLGFRSSANSAYVFNEDAPYLSGNGVISLSSFSADNHKLAINFQPLPKQSLVIPINAAVSTLGVYQLNLTEAVGIPPVYDVWLEDTFLKDSLDLKHNASYSFNIINNPGSYNQRRFNLVIRQNPALGVHLLSFAGVRETDDVKLDWTVENESNYTQYTLQKSTDGGKSFTVIDTLTSAALGTYTDLDLHPVTGPNLYRLEQVDVLGNISYSSVVTVMYAPQSSTIAAESLISVYPNPANATLNLAITQPANTPATTYAITIVNSTGTVVKKASSAQPGWQSDVSSLSPGTYFIQVINSKNNQLVGKATFIKL